MSTFHQHFLEARDRDPAAIPAIGEPMLQAKHDFAGFCLDHHEEPIFSSIYRFSHVIFTCLDFHMEPDEIVQAWEPIESRMNAPMLQELIYKWPLEQEPRDRLLKVFDYIEILSLEGAILARIHGLPKVFPSHMETAFSRFLLWCPYKVEGLCR